MHGNNLNSLHQLILPEILPSELGGMLPPYDMGTWARTLLDHAYDEETDYCPESYTLSVKDLEKDLSPKSMKRFVSFVHYICPFTVFIPPESSRELLWIRKMSCFARGVKKPRSSFCYKNHILSTYLFSWLSNRLPSLVIRHQIRWFIVERLYQVGELWESIVLGLLKVSWVTGSWNQHQARVTGMYRTYTGGMWSVIMCDGDLPLQTFPYLPWLQ